MNWENYEQAVKTIYERLGAEKGVRVVCHGRDCKIKGKSGVEHQVDVLLEHSDGLHTYRTAVECKYWDKRRPKDDVMKLANILEDAHLDKGVIVSKIGFTEDAEAFARHKHIELVELRKPTKEDWRGRLKNIHITLTCRSPIMTNFRIHVVDESADPTAGRSQRADPTQIFISEPEKPKKTLKEITDEMIASANSALSEPRPMLRRFARGTVATNLFDGGPAIKVAAIDFMLAFESFEQSSVIRGEDHVAMIMKSIFDKRRFVISPQGVIRESEA